MIILLKFSNKLNGILKNSFTITLFALYSLRILSILMFFIPKKYSKKYFHKVIRLIAFFAILE